MSKFTRWFSIVIDGQPVRPGFYAVNYGARNIESILYFDGYRWRYDKDDSCTNFGNGCHLAGQRWHGLTEYGYWMETAPCAA